jgi:hypothetical protein
MAADVISMFEVMASNGTAPKEGCRRFGTGYDEAFAKLRERYLQRGFERGRSAEKFVVGPFGSGKTHFIRQLMEIAREEGCVTSEIALSKTVPFTESLIVYREVTRELIVPDHPGRGIRALLEAALAKIAHKAPDPQVATPLVDAWIRGIDSAGFQLSSYARVVQRALQALRRNDDTLFDTACRWLEGDIADRAVAKELGVPVEPRSAHNLHGQRALHSLFQFIRHAGYRGTVVAFDEGEQGLSVPKAQREKILSFLLSSLNAINDLQGGAALIVYALTQDLVEQMETFAALQQRVADPGPSRSFWDGNSLAPKIDLTWRQGQDPEVGLRNIGRRLVELFYQELGDELSEDQVVVQLRVDGIARDVTEKDITSSNRREMVKRTCTLLMHLYEDGTLLEPGEVVARLVEPEEAEV